MFYLYRDTSENMPAITTATGFVYVPLTFDMAILDISSPNLLNSVGKVDNNVVVIPRGRGDGRFPIEASYLFSEVREAATAGN